MVDIIAQIFAVLFLVSVVIFVVHAVGSLSIQLTRGDAEETYPFYKVLLIGFWQIILFVLLIAFVWFISYGISILV